MIRLPWPALEILSMSRTVPFPLANIIFPEIAFLEIEEEQFIFHVTCQMTILTIIQAAVPLCAQ